MPLVPGERAREAVNGGTAVLQQSCFVCGRDNPGGLHTRWTADRAAGEVATTVVLDERTQSHPGLVHGGIVTALLDEAMVRATEGTRAAHLHMGWAGPPTSGDGGGARRDGALKLVACPDPANGGPGP